MGNNGCKRCDILSISHIIYLNQIRMKYSFIILLIILLTACQEKETKKTIIIENFEEKKALTGKLVYLDKMPLITEKIIIAGSFLIIQNPIDNKVPMFYVYNKNDYAFLGSFGAKGGGPNEFSSQNPRMTGQYEIIDNSICIWVIDQFKCKLINLTKSISIKKTVIEKKITTPKSIFIGSEILMLPDGDMFGSCMNQDGRFFYYESKSKKTNWTPFFPKVKNPPIQKEQMHNLYYGPLRINKSGSTIVSALTYFKRIDVFNKDAEFQFSLSFEDSPTDPAFSINKKPETFKYYYMDVYVSENYIYALNLNKSEKQLRERDFKRASEIHVFTIDGKAVSSYTLDYFIGAFTVDEENKCIWGIRMQEKENETQIVRYNF